MTVYCSNCGEDTGRAPDLNMSDIEEANFYAHALCEPCQMKFIFDDFTAEDPLNHETLRRYIERYPDFTKQLLAVFNECQMADLEASGFDK